MNISTDGPHRVHRRIIAGLLAAGTVAVGVSALAVGWPSRDATGTDAARTLRLLELPQPIVMPGGEAVALELAAASRIPAIPEAAPTRNPAANSAAGSTSPRIEPVPTTVHLAATVRDPALALQRLEMIEVPDAPENPVETYATASPFMEGDRRELRPIDDRPVGVLAAEARLRVAAGVGGGGISIGGGDCPDGIGIRGVRRSPIDRSVIPSRLTLGP